LRNDDNFRHDCARYCENIELGQHDEDWLSQAWTAHEKHKRGDYDEFLRQQFEEEWDVKLTEKAKIQSLASDQALAKTEPTDLEQDAAERAASSPSREAQETTAESPNSKRLSQSPHSVIGKDAVQELQGAEKATAEKRDEDIVGNKVAEATKPTNPTSSNPTDPSASPLHEIETVSAVAVQSG
jgi:hypothetical protein